MVILHVSEGTVVLTGWGFVLLLGRDSRNNQIRRTRGETMGKTAKEREAEKRQAKQDDPAKLLFQDVPLTRAEFNELIWLIDDKPVDEEKLLSIRDKLTRKKMRLDRRIEQKYQSDRLRAVREKALSEQNEDVIQ